MLSYLSYLSYSDNMLLLVYYIVINCYTIDPCDDVVDITMSEVSMNVLKKSVMVQPRL